MEDNDNKYKIEEIGETFSKKLTTYKVIILGLSGVGKTTISFQIIKKKYKECSPTISLDLANYQIKVNDKKIQIQFWDACGNEDFAENTPNLFKNTSIAILVYSITDRKSFEDIEKWLHILRDKAMGYQTILIGNKTDLEMERMVQKSEGEKCLKDYNFNYFFETSGKTGFNVNKLLNQIAIILYEKEEKKEKENEDDKKINIVREDIAGKKNISKKKNCC
jgi:small GTP-binding protein